MSASYMKFEEFASYYSQMESVTTPPAYVVLDVNPDLSLSDPRFQIAALADYYLLAIPNRSFFQFDGDTTGNWQNHFFPAITYDVGSRRTAPGPSSPRARTPRTRMPLTRSTSDITAMLWSSTSRSRSRTGIQQPQLVTRQLQLIS